MSVVIEGHEFQEVAETLAPGRKTRAEHCGSGSPMIVSNSRAGYSAYCFRCGGKGFIPHRLSLAERIQQLQAARDADAEALMNPELPGPAEPDPQRWPDDARVWLYKAGLSNDDILALRFYYNERMRRVVMPLFHEGRVIYWQARGFDPALPKAISPSVNRHGLVGRFGTGPVIALTEDILSAVKIGFVTEAWALLGTKADEAVIAALLEARRPVVLALDPDAAGMHGAANIRRRLQSLAVPVHEIYWGTDPKLVPRRKIFDDIQAYLGAGAGQGQDT